MPRIRLTLEYDGTDFAGWQVQPGQRTVQSVVEAAVARLLQAKGRVPVAASGRTDAGVHARGLVAAFDSPAVLPLAAFTKGLNGLLPADVAVVDAAEVDDAFDPRRSAVGKHYRYRMWNGPLRSPLRRRTHWEVRRPLDVAAMAAAAPALLGEHDFTSFRGQGCTAKTPVRRVTCLEVSGRAGGELRVDVEGTGFLRFQVRNMVGTLVEVGAGRLEAAAVAGILAARDRAAAGPTAPARGLTLEAVYYGAREDEGTEG